MALALALAGCGGSTTAPAPATAPARAPAPRPTTPGAAPAGGGGAIKVGILHSLSGQLAATAIPVKDAETLAIEEINRRGGVLGRPLVPVIEDGASRPRTFASRAARLISTDRVAAVFGGETSESLRAMIPVVERASALLYFPGRQAGPEPSRHVFYTGATTNQQILPGLEYLRDRRATRRLFVVGSGDVYSRAASRAVRRWARTRGVQIAGEQNSSLGPNSSADERRHPISYPALVKRIAATRADAVISTFGADASGELFGALASAGRGADALPVMSVSIAEPDLRGIGIENLSGRLVASSYFQSTRGARNRAFVAAYRRKFGARRRTSDAIEAGYASVYLWARAVELAGSTNPGKVRRAARGLKLRLPEGNVSIDPRNQRVARIARIGVIQADGAISQTFRSAGPIAPRP